MITIGQPRIVPVENKFRLEAQINIDKNKEIVWFEVDKEYKDYLCYERTDAFVVGILNYAMRHGHDITCVAPIGEELYYQISTFLIDSVYKGSSKLYKTILHADVDKTDLIPGNAVGTGISCGIDSFNVLSQQTSSKFEKLNVTHLAFNNVGSHGEGEAALTLFNERRRFAKQFAKHNGFEFVESNSNIQDVIPQNHLLTNTYTSTFAIYALQKLYGIYFYASAHSFIEFTLIDNESRDSAYYDLLLTSMFSTKSLTIYSEGANLSRLDKTKQVVEYKPSYQYLNVCIDTSENCGKCEKCIRTLLALDAIGKLNLYKNVFDIDYYKSNRTFYYAEMIKYVFYNNQNYKELYPLLKNNTSVKILLIGLFRSLPFSLIYFFPKSLRPNIKRFYFRLTNRK